MDEPASSITNTLTTANNAEQSEQTVSVKLKSNEESGEKKVAFTEETVDNENLNRKKSKCCCIYEKQRLFGESSEEDENDDDCPDHCHAPKSYHKKVHKKSGDDKPVT